MKKKYSVYCSKAVYGCPDINGDGLVRLFYVFVNDEGDENDKSLIHPIERRGDILCVGDSSFGDNKPPRWFMKSLTYYGEVDSLDDINFNV